MNTRVATLPFAMAQSYASAILKGFHANRILYGIALLSLATALVEALVYGFRPDFIIALYLPGPILLILLGFVMIGLCAETCRLAYSKFEGALFPALWAKLRDDYLGNERVSNGLHLVLAMSIFMTGFAALKASIPRVNAFAWDETFTHIDQTLHFGWHPYELLSPLLSAPFVTSAVSLNYNLWFIVMFIFCFWQGFARDDNNLRQRYLAAYMLTWFFGTGILGTVFSSVGPCFYGKLYPGQIDPFAPLMASLRAAHDVNFNFSLATMDELWNSYERGHGLVQGISAMPSMHVGTCALFIILGFTTGKKWLGWLMVVFGGLIFVGSILLGWHYAVDGYAGVLIAIFCWWLAGKLVDKDRAARGVA